MLRLSLLFSLAMLLTVPKANSQDIPPPIVFGKVPAADLKMTVFEADTTAPALVLCDFGRATIDEFMSSYELRWEQHRRIKILSKEGFSYANVAIPFYTYGNREAFAFMDAAIHLPDGQIIKLRRMSPWSG